MKVVSPDNAEHYTWGEICDGWHLLKSEALSVIEERVPPGGAEAHHYHRRSQQFLYVLSGQATMVLPGETVTIAARQGLAVPPGTPTACSTREGRIFVSWWSPLPEPPGPGTDGLARDQPAPVSPLFRPKFGDNAGHRAELVAQKN